MSRFGWTKGYLWKSVTGKNKKERPLFLEMLCFSGDKRTHKGDASQSTDHSHFYP